MTTIEVSATANAAVARAMKTAWKEQLEVALKLAEPKILPRIGEWAEAAVIDSMDDMADVGLLLVTKGEIPADVDFSYHTTDELFEGIQFRIGGEDFNLDDKAQLELTEVVAKKSLPKRMNKHADADEPGEDYSIKAKVVKVPYDVPKPGTDETQTKYMPAVAVSLRYGPDGPDFPGFDKPAAPAPAPTPAPTTDPKD